MRRIDRKYVYGSNVLDLHKMKPGLTLKLIQMLALALILACSTTGCSILVAEPPIAHVQIEGLNRHLGSFSIDLDPTTDQQVDIHLTDRYALRLDFKWLWERSLSASLSNNDEVSVPWVTCRYQF